jgi:hypothetical protein
MDPKEDIGETSTCTSCTFSQDFSNYWTATLYWRARNGTYRQVPMMENQFLERAIGGLTVCESLTQPYFFVCSVGEN